MFDLLPAIGVLAIAAITPGPNNVLVFNAALHGGTVRVIATIVAIVSGSLMLYGMVKLGLLAILGHSPGVALVLTLGGAAYLIWLGGRMMRSGGPHPETDESPQASALGIFAFQLINPKAWILMGVFASATHQEDRWFLLVLIMVSVFTACLSIWALAGAALARLARTPSLVRVANCVMGVSLIVFAGLIGAQQIALVLA